MKPVSSDQFRFIFPQYHMSGQYETVCLSVYDLITNISPGYSSRFISRLTVITISGPRLPGDVSSGVYLRPGCRDKDACCYTAASELSGNDKWFTKESVLIEGLFYESRARVNLRYESSR